MTKKAFSVAQDGSTLILKHTPANLLAEKSAVLNDNFTFQAMAESPTFNIIEYRGLNFAYFKGDEGLDEEVLNLMSGKNYYFDIALLKVPIQFIDIPYETKMENQKNVIAAIPQPNIRATIYNGDDAGDITDMFVPLAYIFGESADPNTLYSPFDYTHFCTHPVYAAGGLTACSEALAYNNNPTRLKLFYFDGEFSPNRGYPKVKLNHYLVPTILPNKTIVFCAFENPGTSDKSSLHSFLNNYLEFEGKHVVGLNSDLLFDDDLGIFICFNSELKYQPGIIGG